MRERIVQLLSVVLLIGAWAIVSVLISNGVFPGPHEVLPQLERLITTGRFVDPLLQSLQRTTVGFVLGFVAGVAYGIAAAKLRWFSLSTALLVNIALFAPTLVIIFLGLVMLGTELIAVALITAVVVAPNIAIYMRDVMRDVDPSVLAMADSYKVSSLRRVRDIYLPYLIPPMLAASRIGFSMAWKVVMLSEVFGFPGGLGFQIRISYTAYNLPVLLAWLSIFVLALLVIEQGIRITERRLVRWRA